MKVVLDDNAKMPTKAHSYDAGYDLFAREDFTVPATTLKKKKWWKLFDREVCIGQAVHDTGVHIEIPEGYVGFIKSKSGLNVKHGITAEGVIDAGYTGPIVVKLYNHTAKNYHFNKGDKITQLVILPINIDTLELADTLEDTERGAGGFGSTGK